MAHHHSPPAKPAAASDLSAADLASAVDAIDYLPDETSKHVVRRLLGMARQAANGRPVFRYVRSGDHYDDAFEVGTGTQTRTVSLGPDHLGTAITFWMVLASASLRSDCNDALAAQCREGSLTPNALRNRRDRLARYIESELREKRVAAALRQVAVLTDGTLHPRPSLHVDCGEPFA